MRGIHHATRVDCTERWRPPIVMSVERDEWQHGWQCQYHASSPSDHHFRDHGAVTSMPVRPSTLAVSFRTRIERDLVGVPTGADQGVARTLPHCGLREMCGYRCWWCGTALDTFGRHRTACPHSGRLKRRVAPERTLSRICREAVP